MNDLSRLEHWLQSACLICMHVEHLAARPLTCIRGRACASAAAPSPYITYSVRCSVRSERYMSANSSKGEDAGSDRQAVSCTCVHSQNTVSQMWSSWMQEGRHLQRQVLCLHTADDQAVTGTAEVTSMKTLGPFLGQRACCRMSSAEMHILAPVYVYPVCLHMHNVVFGSPRKP